MPTTKPDFTNLNAADWDVVNLRDGDALHKPTGEIYRLGTETISKMISKPDVDLSKKPAPKPEV